MVDLIGLEGLSGNEIVRLLDAAEQFKKTAEPEPALSGRVIGLLFFEPSTRTRASFEVAAKRLGAHPLAMPMDASSVVKGESLEDTLANLEAIGVELFVIRHPDSGSAERAARAAKVPVVNAGDGWHEHPTQALLDIFTIREKLGRLKGLEVAILGDILHSRVARSNLWGLTRLGAKVVVCGPPTLIPKGIEKWARVAASPEGALAKADAAIVLRIQAERQKEGLFPTLAEYRRGYALTRERLARAKPGCLVLHPGPINRGVELDSDVADGAQSVILEQVRNGVFVRMAVFSELLGSKGRVG
jgi:aspartate carbamoyltransferase catalytic subunit